MSSYHDYQWATETLATARSEEAGKPVQNNTRLFRRSDGSIAVKLHAVDVVTINSDGTWTLRAEGWHTVTTLERIRAYSPVKLFSDKGEWFVRLEPREDDPRPARVNRTIPNAFTATDPGPKPEGDSWGNWQWRQDADKFNTYIEMMSRFGSMEAWKQAALEDFRARKAYLKAEREWEQRNRIPFYDGITVDSDGYAPRLRKDGPSPAKLRRHEAKVKKVKASIEKYVDGYMAALAKGMPMPGNGDCWFCLLHDKDGKTWGDMGSSDHLEQHFKDRYYVPMLAVNALREAGYRDVGIYIHLGMSEAGTMGGGRVSTDLVKRDLRKYLNKRMIPTAPTK